MNAAIIERNWVVEWFDERQCYHMPSLTMAPDGTLLAVWNGGFLQWNGDPMAVTPRTGSPDSSRAQKLEQSGRRRLRHPLLLPRPHFF